jgi:flagellar motor protein MotB
MARRSRYTEYNEDLNVWTAFTDLMSNAFMILVLFLFLTIIISQISGKKSTDTPPIIVIKDEGAYRFASGSAEISQEMLNYILKQIVPEIETRTKEYGINVVEIIGHTDGQANAQVTSNLDVNLENVVSGNIPVRNLQAGSNADLGLMRALSVVKALRDIQTKENRLSGLSFRAYSAAQLILPNGQFAAMARQDDVTRRRIEIRFTRLGEVQEVR